MAKTDAFDIEALALEVLESENPQVKGWLALAENCEAQVDRKSASQRHKNVYGRYLGKNLIDAVGEAHQDLTHIGVMKVATRLAEMGHG